MATTVSGFGTHSRSFLIIIYKNIAIFSLFLMEILTMATEDHFFVKKYIILLF
jgi:hypothetical protein